MSEIVKRNRNDVTLPDRKRMAIELLVDGMSQADIAQKLSINRKTLYTWLKEDPELVAEVHAKMKARAVMERPRNFEVFMDVRDNGRNEMARLKAAEALEARAGVVFQVEQGAPTVVILGQQVTVADVKGSELVEILKAAATKCGPKVEKIIDAELTGNTALKNPGSDSGGADPGTPQAPGDGEGEAA